MKEYEQRATKIIMNIVEGVKAQIRKAYDKGYKDGTKEKLANAMIYDHEEAEKKAYDRGLNDAWNAAKKIHDGQISYEVFGLDKTGNGLSYASPLNWGETITAQEVIAKIKEYEDKQDAEIKVGDEVYSDAFDDKGIVTYITTDKVSCVCIICNGFTMMKVGLCGLHKTGRHFDQIAEVLAELRGAENDE